MPSWYFDLLAFLLGLFFGSFLNVCIWRIPRRQSIVYPPSACPKCQAPIAFYDNIPIISYVFLLGRCRKCREPISLRYPVVELLTALLFLACAVKFGISWNCLRGVLLAGLLVVLAFIDLDTLTVPDAISIPGIAAGLLTGLLVSGGMVAALIGGAVGTTLILLAMLLSWLLGRLGWQLFQDKQGMGAGDLFLGALIGVFLGWKLALLSVFLGVVAGVMIGTALILLGRREWGRHIPFGPFLAIGSLLALFLGDAILRWYWNLFRH
jgi:leader peptidase (prepilin peptidase) / N-methyltransferase